MGGNVPGARRRGRNEGPIYKDDAKGRWYGAVSLGYDADGQTWRRHKVSGRTRAEVVRKLKELQAEKDSGVQPEHAYMVSGPPPTGSPKGWTAGRPGRSGSTMTSSGW
jgi:hypothetical protein